MRPILDMVSAVFLVGCIVTAAAVAGEQKIPLNPCKGPFNSCKTPSDCKGPFRCCNIPSDEQLTDILKNHRAWVESKGGPHDERRADLCQVYLEKGNLQGARLDEANFQEAFLHWINLREASLVKANLQKADLGGVDLTGANLTGANLTGTIYEPDADKLPLLWSLTSPDTKLEELVFKRNPASLIKLRQAFKDAGMRTQERQLTYAVERTKRLQAWTSENLWDKGESLFKLVAFELPSAYGMYPGRSLKILVGSIGLFALVYIVPLFTARGHPGIWMIWLSDQVHKTETKVPPLRVTSTFWFSRLQMKRSSRWWRGLWHVMSALLMGLYFSILSAFSLGWRDLNVGTWIARMQPREYALRATGWVRTMSGIQSLLSVYLLALWVLTYFGRPFE